MVEKLNKAMKKLLMERGIRKYTLILICMGVLSLGLVATGVFPAAASSYTVFAGSVVALYGVYCGGNVASKWSPTSSEEEEERLKQEGPQQ